MEPFLLEVPARNQLMKTMFACKSWNTKNLCRMGHAIKGGKLILLQRVVIIFRLELHLWTHPLLLKISSSLLPTISGIFWCFILTSIRLCLPYLFILFHLCYLHPWPCLIWPNSHHAFCYWNIWCYTTSMARTFCIFHMHLFKWSIHYQVNNYLSLYGSVWEFIREWNRME